MHGTRPVSNVLARLHISAIALLYVSSIDSISKKRSSFENFYSTLVKGVCVCVCVCGCGGGNLGMCSHFQTALDMASTFL